MKDQFNWFLWSVISISMIVLIVGANAKVWIARFKASNKASKSRMRARYIDLIRREKEPPPC